MPDTTGPQNATPAQIAVARGYLRALAAFASASPQDAARVEALADDTVVARTVRAWPEGWDHFCATFADYVASHETEPRELVRAYDAIQQARSDATARAALEQVRARAREMLAEWRRLVALHHAAPETVAPAAHQADDADMSPEIDAATKELTAYMRDHYDDLVGQPIWREWFADGAEPRRPRTAQVSAPILTNDPPF